MKFLHPINLVQNELQNARIQNLASHPESPKIGQIYFNTTSQELKVYSSSGWDIIGKEYVLGNDILQANISTNVADNTLTYTRFATSASGVLSLDSIPSVGTENLTWSGIFNTNSITLHSPTGAVLTAGSNSIAVTSDKATSTDLTISAANDGAGSANVLVNAKSSIDLNAPVINLTDDLRINSSTNDIIYKDGSFESKLNWESLDGNVTLLLPDMSQHPLYGTGAGQKTQFTLATTDDVPPITPLSSLFDFSYDNDPNSNEFGELVLEPYVARAAGQFYSGTDDPTATTRLNYDGNLHVTNMFADNITVGTFNNLTLTALTDGFTVAGGTEDERSLTVTGGDMTLTGHVSGTTFTVVPQSMTINDLTANHVLYTSAANTISGEAQLATTRGGTGIGTYTKGDILYSDATNSLAKLSIGQENDFLRVVAGVPVWSDWDVEETATFGELVVKKYGDPQDPDTTGDFTVEGNSNLLGNLTIAGNLTVSGTTTTLDTEQVNIKDNIIQINSNQTGTPASSLVSGLEVNRGDLVNYQFVFVENTKDFRIGKIGSLQPVLTRSETTQLDPTDILVWDADNKRAIGKTFDELALPNKYAATINISAGQSFTVTHNLNTTDVVVSLKDITTGSTSLNEMIYADIKTTGVNTVDLTFGEINGVQNVRVTVIG